MQAPALTKRRAVFGLALFVWTACSIRTQVPELHEPTDPVAKTKQRSQLKVHLKSGELVVLDTWQVAPGQDRLSGTGQAWTAGREPKGTPGAQDLALADVALLETTSSEAVSAIGLGALVVTTLALGSLSVYCAVSPKSCFGSCPTFYLEDAGGAGRTSDRPQAEGFSASIARVLEARDVDALLEARPGGTRVTLTMRNEALETHAVRRVRLLAVPRPAGGRVLAGVDERFYPTQKLVAPLACRASEGDCTELLRAVDGQDRSVPADAADLASRESVELVFPPARGPSGIAIDARQTLLSTYLFYQTMAFFGRDAGEFLAALERGGPALGARAMGMARRLGGIEVEVAEGDSAWRAIGSFDEPGPIAGDLRVVPFVATGTSPLRVRLRLAKGHWRTDFVALARLGPPVAPAVLEPVWVERAGRRDEAARARLVSGERHLVTHPRDAYRIGFELPASGVPLELFLESEGFYYEWMRREWLAEEDPAMAALALADPAEALRRLAPAFKQHEPGLEQAFWASRLRK